MAAGCGCERKRELKAPHRIFRLRRFPLFAARYEFLGEFSC
jgi:hypothetical protein